MIISEPPVLCIDCRRASRPPVPVSLNNGPCTRGSRGLCPSPSGRGWFGADVKGQSSLLAVGGDATAGQLRLGVERRVIWDAGGAGAGALAVLGPDPWEVELAVD